MFEILFIYLLFFMLFLCFYLKQKKYMYREPLHIYIYIYIYLFRLWFSTHAQYPIECKLLLLLFIIGCCFMLKPIQAM